MTASDRDWQEMASFVLPYRTVSGAIQGALTFQRIRDIAAIRRVTGVTDAAHRSAVDSMKRAELADEQIVDRHREAMTSEADIE